MTQATTAAVSSPVAAENTKFSDAVVRHVNDLEVKDAANRIFRGNQAVIEAAQAAEDAKGFWGTLRRVGRGTLNLANAAVGISAGLLVLLEVRREIRGRSEAPRGWFGR